MTTRILLDVDTGTDDALALLYAVAHPDLEVLGVSCVAGNAGLDRVLDNTAKVLDAADARPDLPVAAGASKPLIERSPLEGHFHGEDGLGGIALPATTRPPYDRSAVEMLYEQITASGSPVTLISLAPMTNIAALLTVHPDVADHLDRLIFMGGSASVGNVTAVAEFNVWRDPEAATCVIESGVPISMYGLDVFNRLLVGRDVADRWTASDHPAVRLAAELLYRRGLRSDGTASDYLGVIGDAGAVVFLTHPELFTTETLPVRVNLTGIGRGQTIVDRRPAVQDYAARALDPWPEIEVALDLDVEAAAQVFVDVIESYEP